MQITFIELLSSGFLDLLSLTVQMNRSLRWQTVSVFVEYIFLTYNTELFHDKHLLLSLLFGGCIWTRHSIFFKLGCHVNKLNSYFVFSSSLHTNLLFCIFPMDFLGLKFRFLHFIFMLFSSFVVEFASCFSFIFFPSLPVNCSSLNSWMASHCFTFVAVLPVKRRQMLFTVFFHFVSLVFLTKKRVFESQGWCSFVCLFVFLQWRQRCPPHKTWLWWPSTLITL